MKKITLLAFACAMFLAPVANAQEVTYVEDPAQGYVFNQFSDNWFVEAEGGVGYMMSQWDRKADFKDRIGWKANLGVGKWFSPIIGLRAGGEISKMRGATVAGRTNALGYRSDKPLENGYVKQNWNRIGGYADVLLNVTNWWLGYKPNRFYNAVVYAGFGYNYNFEREKLDSKSDWKYDRGAKKPHSRDFSARAGLLNEFRVSNHVNVLLDLRFDEIQEFADGVGVKGWIEYPSVLLGLQYKFNKTEWNAPVVPVCNQTVVVDNSAELEALRQKLAQANAKIADLEYQLAECLKKIKPVDPNVVVKQGPLATIYYPIGKSNITPVQMEVVNAVAEVMKAEDNNYVLTGWADNYTGTDAINIKLRHDRVNGVKNTLVNKGIEAGRLAAETNNENLVNLGPQCAPLGRAVTIERAE